MKLKSLLNESIKKMNWIEVTDVRNIPFETNVIIVEDENGWIGNACLNGDDICLETFNQTRTINFGKIIRYLILPN